jgi:hypothetical protein
MWKFQAGNALALTIWDFSVPVHIIGGLWLVSLFLDILLETMKVDHLQNLQDALTILYIAAILIDAFRICFELLCIWVCIYMYIYIIDNI